MRALGIDFGTTNTAASVLNDDGTVTLIALDPPARDARLFKTLLYFPNRKEAFFGAQAIENYFERDMEGRFLQSIKRLLPNPDFQGTSVFGTFTSLEELISRFIRETRARIEQVAGPIGDAEIIMGRPARYSAESGNEGLAVVRFRKACDMAGFPKVKLVEEPVAAALTYQPETDAEERVLVADLGGGTSDFTLMSIRRGEKPRVLSVHGVSVAGDAVDSAFFSAKLTRFFGSEIRYQRPFSSNVLTLPTTFVRLLPKWHHHAFLKEKATWNFLTTLHRELVDPKDKAWLDNLITLVDDNQGYALHQKVEELKIVLSTEEKAPFVFRSHPIKIEFDVTRAEFESFAEPVADAVSAAAIETMRQARVNMDELDAVYFTGGTSRIPLLRRRILDNFPKARVVEKDTFTSVAAGLALSHSG